MSVIDLLYERLNEIRNSSTAGELPWKKWIDKPLRIMPWQAWTLLCLVRHRDRQQFVADTIKRLRADQLALAESGAGAHPDIPQQGVVPGMSDWEYYFHGRGCCLTHRVTGESIDVDFYDGTADWIDRFFVIRYLESLKSPTYVEERVLALHASVDTVLLSINDLPEEGLLEEYYAAVCLNFDHEELAEALDDIEFKWHDEATRRAVAAAVGDWFLLEKLAPSESNVIAEVRDNLNSCIAERSARLVDQLRDSDTHPADAHAALMALSEIESPMLPAVLREVLLAEPSAATSAAITIIDELDDATWCDEVQSLMDRIDPNEEDPQPFVWDIGARFLLRHGRTANIKRQLQTIESHGLDDASLLALEYFPDIAIEVFRRALRSDIPCNRCTAAAALAIIDQPWSRTELAEVLKESDDHKMTAECRSAAAHSLSHELHLLLLDWEKRHPREIKVGQTITSDELSIRRSDDWMNFEMEQLHDRVMKLRNVIPESPGRDHAGR